MAAVVYILCSITSIYCAWMLLRSYRNNGWRLSLWSSLCFAGLALNNILLFIDRIVIGPEVDLSIMRGIAAVVGLGLMIYGLIWETV